VAWGWAELGGRATRLEPDQTRVELDSTQLATRAANSTRLVPKGLELQPLVTRPPELRVQLEFNSKLDSNSRLWSHELDSTRLDSRRRHAPRPAPVLTPEPGPPPRVARLRLRARPFLRLSIRNHLQARAPAKFERQRRNGRWSRSHDPVSARQPLRTARRRNRPALTAAHLSRVTFAWRAARGRVRAPTGGVGHARSQGFEAGSSRRLPWPFPTTPPLQSACATVWTSLVQGRRLCLGLPRLSPPSDCEALQARWSPRGGSSAPTLSSELAF